MRKQQLNQAPIPSHYLISFPEDYTAPLTTINPILRRTVAILGAPSRGFLAVVERPTAAAFRTISLVNIEMKRLPI
jgi:hypothetical protein